MSVTITDEQVLELVRVEVHGLVAEMRPAIRAELIREMEFVTEEEGVSILKIGGKDPVRTFRRLMNDYGVHRIERLSQTLYKRVGDHSVMSTLDKWTKKPASRKQTSNAERPTSNIQLVGDAAA